MLTLVLHRRSLRAWKEVAQALWKVLGTLPEVVGFLSMGIAIGGSFVGAGVVSGSALALWMGIGGICGGIVLYGVLCAAGERAHWEGLVGASSEVWAAEQRHDPPHRHVRRDLVLALLSQRSRSLLLALSPARGTGLSAGEMLSFVLSHEKDMSREELEVVSSLAENFEGDVAELLEASEVLARG